MPLFQYEALDKRGKMVRGTIDSPDDHEVVNRLRGMGYYPLRVDGAGSGAKPDQVAPEDHARMRAVDERIMRDLEALRSSFCGDDLPFEDWVASVEALALRAEEGSPQVIASVRQHLRDLSAVTEPEALRARMQEEARTADTESQWARQRAALMRAGNPQAYAGERLDIAPGWLREPMGERFGVLCLGADRDIVWLDQDPATLKPTAVKSLCSWEDFESIAKRGLFKRRAVLRAKRGLVWTIRLDPRRSSANVSRLNLIIRIETGQAASDR